MLVKIIIIFLLAMVLVGMVGKLLFPDAASRAFRRVSARPKACPKCGRPLIGKSCDCKKGRT